ncbi:hypothetical protein C0583_04445 [Candidatus Parcubacteria bacterium]|nr:MAG: hypothetical protein C0583_04445 [Candidatus Parcubacteria bacterium]
MLKLITRFVFGLAFIFVFSLMTITSVEASEVSAPTVLKINTFKSYAIDAPVISGVTQSGTNVLVYVDGEYTGSAVVKESGTESDSFYFQTKKLEAGIHKAYLVAEDKTTMERSDPGAEFDLEVRELDAPTLVVPNPKTVTAKVKPVIKGLTLSGTYVHLFIDGVYNGKTAIVEDQSTTANFAYTPFLNLSIGNHYVWAIAEDVNGRKSKVSAVQEFTIEEEMVAPILVKTIDNQSNFKRPIITGLATNNSLIQIYIDQRLAGEFMVENSDTGTANFAYTVENDLSSGDHLFYAIAFDHRGKESKWSNLMSYKVGATLTPAISSSAESEELVIGTEEKQEESVERNVKTEEMLTEENNGQVDQGDEEADEDTMNEEEDSIEKILNQDLENEEGETKGAVTELNDSQGKLGWNALVFVLFLVAVILWIFWVNRELIKEKKEQEEKEK